MVNENKNNENYIKNKETKVIENKDGTIKIVESGLEYNNNDKLIDYATGSRSKLWEKILKDYGQFSKGTRSLLIAKLDSN